MSQTALELPIVSSPRFGAHLCDEGVEFVVYSRSATLVRVLLYDRPWDTEPARSVELARSAGLPEGEWRAFVAGLSAGQLYHLQADGPRNPEEGHRFDSKARLIDPYAHALAGDFLTSYDDGIRPPKCVIIDHEFHWEDDHPPRHDLASTVIYEMHVRGFTKSPSSSVSCPGTYLGLIEKIPYLKSLGITAVELLPVHEFPILDVHGRKPARPNYWGYDPLAWFAPHRGYAADKSPGAQVVEFKRMVKALHSAGIELILDVVFNHTAEGGDGGHVLSWKGLENQDYYLLKDIGAYSNYSQCGNTVNCNHPVVREMIIDCLRHWVHAYHVDGFRFDLATILNLDQKRHLHSCSPLVKEIGTHPDFEDIKLIAEPWDAVGAYQLGTFGTESGSNHQGKPRWCQWNDFFRSDVRRFWRGDEHTAGGIISRFDGSRDFFPSGRNVHLSNLNFVTAHDGFTLNDLVMYSHKHNHDNGEGNVDGFDMNFSHNYGAEGPTQDKGIRAVRLRQIKNFLVTLLLSRGVPMLTSGDECRRTQRGNNNAYCQDNDVSWFDWCLVDRHRELVEFCSKLIAFRHEHPLFVNELSRRHRSARADGPAEPCWYDRLGLPIDLHTAEATAQRYLETDSAAGAGEAFGGRAILFMMNGSRHNLEFRLPATLQTVAWYWLINTAADPPDDILWGGPRRRLDQSRSLELLGHTLCVFLSPA